MPMPFKTFAQLRADARLSVARGLPLYDFVNRSICLCFGRCRNKRFRSLLIEQLRPFLRPILIIICSATIDLIQFTGPVDVRKSNYTSITALSPFLFFFVFVSFVGHDLFVSYANEQHFLLRPLWFGNNIPFFSSFTHFQQHSFAGSRTHLEDGNTSTRLILFVHLAFPCKCDVHN